MEYIPDIPYYNLDDLRSPVLEPTIDIIDDPISSPISTIDPTSAHLYALDLYLQDHPSGRPTYYQSALTHISADHLCAHMDAGSMASTTDRLEYLWDVRSLTGTTTVLRVADDNPHYPVGIGYLRVPTLGSSGSFTLVRTFYTPTLPATILSPCSIATDLGGEGYSSFANLDGTECRLTIHGRQSDQSVTFPLRLQHSLLFTQALQRAPDLQHSVSNSPFPVNHTVSTDAVSSSVSLIHHLSQEQLSHLWHQRLGHINRRQVSTMHKYAHGIPKLPLPSDLDNCPVCLASKLHQAARGTQDSRHVTQCFQGISVNFGFIVQRSADSSRLSQLRGLDGETCYCLLVCHYSGMLFGEPFRSKAPPIDFLNRWLAKYGLPTTVSGKYVRMDQGGELGRCPDIVSLFEAAGYNPELTAPNSSHQNGPGERPHRTIADAMRTMLAGAALAPSFWPYAFRHYLWLYNMTPHRSDDTSPYTCCTGKLPDLSKLRTFGCRIYALPPRDRRRDKLRSDSRTGLFLGYTQP